MVKFPVPERMPVAVAVTSPVLGLTLNGVEFNESTTEYAGVVKP